MVKEYTQTSGLFDFISGGLITKMGNTRGQANWESGDSGVVCMGHVMFELRGSCRRLAGYGKGGQKAGMPERDLKSTKQRRQFKGKGYNSKLMGLLRDRRQRKKE